MKGYIFNDKIPSKKFDGKSNSSKYPMLVTQTRRVSRPRSNPTLFISLRGCPQKRRRFEKDLFFNLRLRRESRYGGNTTNYGV